MKKEKQAISQKLINSVCSRLLDNKAVRKTLPGWGRIHIDRQLPFLCIYRKPSDRSDIGTKRLVYGEASYIIASGDPDYHDGLAELVKQISQIMSERFGAFLLVELWSLQDVGEDETVEAESQKPECTIFSPKLGLLTPTVEVLKIVSQPCQSIVSVAKLICSFPRPLLLRNFPHCFRRRYR